jgi:uncharacterized protein (DUF433 family)
MIGPHSLRDNKDIKVDKKELLKRITSNPAIFRGKSIIRNLRIRVEVILDLLSQGASQFEILKDFPSLEAHDILACLAYARSVIADEEIEDLNIEKRA